MSEGLFPVFQRTLDPNHQDYLPLSDPFAHQQQQLSAIMSDLKTAFPYEIPTPNQTEREILYAAGQQSVINYLSGRIEILNKRNYGQH